jgi:hypothetical protein
MKQIRIKYVNIDLKILQKKQHITMITSYFFTETLLFNKSHKRLLAYRMKLVINRNVRYIYGL